MLLVKTHIGPSPVHGNGVFADQFIPKGTIIWRFSAGHDECLTYAEFEALPPGERMARIRCGYVSRFTGNVITAGDNYTCTNHSHHPNIGVSPVFEPPEGCDIALRDIQPGEELLFDYTWFGEDPCCRPEEGRLPAPETFIGNLTFAPAPTIRLRSGGG